MYRLPDSQRGALRSTSLALAREASREDGHGSDSGHHHYNPFKGFKRLYSGLRKHRSRGHSPPEDDTKLRKFYSTPLGGGTRDTAARDSSPPLADAPAVHHSKTSQDAKAHRKSDSELNSSTSVLSEGEGDQTPPKSPSRMAKH
ncbi:hypothetical protein IWW38_003510, partial [Coemansia aciculifera]